MEGRVIIGGGPGRFARRAERLGAIVVAIALSLFPVGCQQPRVRVAGRASKRGVGGGRVPPAPHQWIRAPRGISWEGGGEEAKSMRARRACFFFIPAWGVGISGCGCCGAVVYWAIQVACGVV